MKPLRFFSTNRRRWIAGITLCLLFAAAIIQTLPVFAATLTVNSTLDRADANPGNGVCQTATAGECTLRAAIQEANALPGADTIQLAAGVYELGIPTVNDDADSTGDFDIRAPLTIIGLGAASSIIDGGFPQQGAPPTAIGLDRLFEIHPGTLNVTFKDLTLREGYTIDDGAAIQNWSSGLLKLENVHVVKNLAGGVGGGINNAEPAGYTWATTPPVMPKSGRVEIRNATFSGNAAGQGAAINNVGTGTITILANSQIVDNPGQIIPDPLDPTKMIPAPGVYEPGGAAIANEAHLGAVGVINIADATIARNYSTSDGAGIHNGGSGTILLERTTVADNTSEAAGGGLYAAGGAVTILNSTISGNHANEGAGLYSGGDTNAVGLRSRVTVANSTIAENEAATAGGGLANGGDAQLILTDVIFENNKAEDAGAGLESSGFASADLTRVSFMGNIAHGEGGGAWIGSTRLSTIQDSLFRNNQGGAPTVEDPANQAAGGGLYSQTGPITISGSTFEGNTASGEGGGMTLDNFSDVTVSDTIIRNNRAGTDGGGVENSGTRVTFERLLITDNYAVVDGGGIHNSSSGPFSILDTTIQLNSAVNGGGLGNAPDNALIVRNSLFYRNTARYPGLGEDGLPADGGHGGGLFSMADGASMLENTTFSGNTAGVGGGGLFHDADGELKLINLTIWRNSAPSGGGVSVVESDFVPTLPPQPNHSVIVRNTIIGGSLEGGSCDWYLTTEGGNIDTGSTCFLSVADPDGHASDGRDWRSPAFAVDAIADNGGHTLSHALREGSIAIDAAVGACAAADQRGVSRPQNARCDIGAYEYEGDPPPADSVAPDSEYLSGPIQDSLETVAFTFTGSDNVTPADELQFECRLIVFDPTEPPEPLAPWDPIPPELQWLGCSSPWQSPLLEEGQYNFEVRAIDRNGNIDPTPDVYTFTGLDTIAPQTIIAEKPPLTTNSRAATFTFTGTDNQTPPQFLEFECRLDTNDPDLWLECINPVLFSNLTSGSHTIEVRAIDGGDNFDPTPARYTWTVGQPANAPINCDLANITLTASADAWVDEVNPIENFLFQTDLGVASAVVGNPAAVPPEPLIGQNARALLRFALPNDATGCVLESATLRLYNDSPSEGRTLEAVPLTGSWLESTVTWFNQPAAANTVSATSTTATNPGYQDWNVLDHVEGMIASGVNHGWVIRDAVESDPEGTGQSFASRETFQDPPEMTLPILVLRYAADTAPPPAPPVPATTATTVYCGQVILQSTLVANDLTNCLGEGLIIGAPNLVLDLNGHIIDGPDYLALNLGAEEGFPAGIRNSGHTNVVIKNGTVQQFGWGVHLTPGTTRNIVENLTLTRHAVAAIELFDADDGRNGNTLRNNTIFDSELGIAILADSQNSVLLNNNIDGNLGEAILIEFSDGHRIEGNRISGIPVDPNFGSDMGVLLTGSSNNVFLNNVIQDTGDTGINVSASSNNNRFEGNTMVRNGDAGIGVQDSHGSQIINNISHQQSDGGVALNNANDTVIRGNDLRFNPSGVEAGGANNLIVENNDGSESLQSGFELGNSINMIVRNNVANQTGGSGISVESAEFDANGNAIGGALIEGNTTNENRENGISVADGGHTLRDNNAHNNAGFGILAGDPPPPGQAAVPNSNIDGGENRATGNGEVTQCVGVVCDEGNPVPTSTPDITPPVAIIVDGPGTMSGTVSNSTSATFVFTGTDNHYPATALVFECRLDPGPDPLPEPTETPDPELPEPPVPGETPEPIETPDPIDPGNWFTCISPQHYHNLQQGDHHFEVRARDQAEPPNMGLIAATYNWIIDITTGGGSSGPDSSAPTTRITTAPAGSTASTAATFYFSGSDDQTAGLNLSFECQLDGGGFSACAVPQPQSYTGLAPGSHTFAVRARDAAGNMDATPALHTWTIIVPPADTTPPDTTLTPGPDAVTALTEATFTFASNESGATFECSIDAGVTYAVCTSPRTYTGLATGARDFRVRAVDAAGNVDGTPASYTWTITAAPVLTTAFCGQSVMYSIKLNNDLLDCPWDGLVVGAPNITIDLNGHSLDGVGLAGGIRNDGHDNVTIKNGTVNGFDYGVALNAGTVNNIVEGMTLQNNQEAGLALGNAPYQTDPTQPPVEPPSASFQSGVSGNILRNNLVLSNEGGIWLTNRTAGTLIINNLLAANAKEGVYLERADNNRVETNEISGSSSGAVILHGANNNTILNNILAESGSGVFIAATSTGVIGQPSNNNIVEGNQMSEIGGDAMEINDSEGNELISNSAHGSNGSGISLYHGTNNLLRGNDVSNNKNGIALKGSSGNRLEGNNTSESESTGITLEALSFDNEIVGNNSSNNDGDGMYIGDETTGDQGMLIEGNTTNNNVGYGIYASKVSHTIKDNIANDNGGWGIWVSDGSNGRVNIDGGGNRAQGNLGPLDPLTLKPMQCFSVTCTGGPPTNNDQIAPDTLILQAPTNPSTNEIATFHFNGSDNAGAVTFQCSIDASAFAPCVSPAAYTLTLGVHTFAVRAADVGGNIDLTPATLTWAILAAPAGAPETTITAGPDLTTVSTAASFSFAASESGSTFACALDGGSFTACTSPKSYTGLAVGAHTFSVRATDPSAETDTTPATYAWTIGSAPVAAEVTCGEFVVQSIRLTNDLLDCTGHGLIIGANGITIDLNGHVIDGTGLDAGILNNGYDSVTIMNGTIHEFDYGVLLNAGTSLNVLTGLHPENNAEAGIALSDADQNGKGNTIRDNTVVGNGHGIALLSNTRFALVQNNALGANTGDGIRIEFSSDNRIEGNEIATSGGAGIVMESGGNNTVIDNNLSANLGFGIAAGAELLASNGNLIERNTINGGQGGISVVSSINNTVRYNVVSGATGAGVVVERAQNTVVLGNDLRGNAGGISLDEAINNRIESNNASGTLGTGIEIGALSYNNVVVQNSANINGGEGIHVVDTAPAGLANVIDGNTADGNSGDGIAVDGVGHTLVGNRASINGGWGIYAAAGATDGGGNFAAGNVEPAQCFGINCTLGTVPGTPETWIVTAPPATSNSRNASFTYLGSDAATPLIDLIFECRLDSTNDLAWEECEYPAEYLNLTPGTHVFEVRAVEPSLLADPSPAQHIWTYQPLPVGVAPTVTIDLAPEPATWLLDSLFTFHANEPDVALECKVDFLGYAPCGFEGASYMAQGAFEHSLAETEVGLHTFSVRAIDFEGNVGVPTTYTWRLLGVATVFTAGPGFTPGETPFDPATGGPVTENNATITFVANVADATFQCSLDLAIFTPCTSPLIYTGLTAGAHELRIIATDAEGNVELEPAAYEWEVIETVDVDPPTTTIERAPAPNSSATIFEFSGADNLTPPQLLTFECRVDSTNELDWTVCVSPFNLLDLYTYADTQMAPGQHTFEVRARDMAEPVDPNAPQEGNVDPTPASYTWTMVADTTPPGTGILSGPAAQTGDPNAEFTFLGSDNATPLLALNYECAVDAGLFAACSSPETVTVEPGLHTFRVRAIDLAGNLDPTPITRTWTLVPAPVTTITSGPGGRIVNGVPPATASTVQNAVFAFSANQANSTFACSFNGAEFTPCTSPRAYGISIDGTYEFAVRATNPQGVVEEPPVVYEWLAQLGPDTVGPNTTITANPTNPDTNSVATFSFIGSDNRTPSAELVFECALDGTAYNTCVAPQQFSDLQRGSHTLLVRARDAAGNFDTTPASYTWIVEPPPVSVILTGPAELTESRVATFTFQADVAGSTFQCWLDGLLEPCTSPKSYSNLTAGDHLFAVLAAAPAGTSELAWVEYEWTIGDLSAPLTTITSAPDLETTSLTATFAFSANEPDATFQCSINGAALAPCSSPLTYPRLFPGPNRFEVVAASRPLTDAFGLPVEPLYEPVPVSYEWTIVDLEAPDTIIQYGPPTTTASINAYFGFYTDDPTALIECSLDGEPFSECESPAEFTDLLAGAHTLVARAVDLAGNVDPTPATYTWTVVQLPPNTPAGTNVTVNLPLPDGSGTATLNFFEVTQLGVTTLDALTGAPPLPAGYLLAGGRYYDVHSTAEFTAPATLCIPYNPASFEGSAARLLHFDGAQWIDVTVTNNPATGLVCGQPESFSPFALVAGSGVAPLASIISGPPNPSSSSSNATFSFAADQPDAQILCALDGLPFAPCASPVTYTHLEEGGHDFQLQAIGSDGQIQLVPALYEWEVILGPDTTAPDTVITKGPATLTANFISLFEFSGSDDQTAAIDLEFECALDGTVLGSCSTPEEIEVLAAGVHTLTVSAMDTAGNVDPTPATRTWTVIDLSAPDTSIDVGPASETEATSAVFEFTGVDGLTDLPVFDFQCALDNADFAPCTSPHTVTGLTVGAHVLQVRAMDLAGVVDPVPDFYEWLIIGTSDITPPDTFIVSGPPVGNSGPDVIFGFNSNEPVENFECALDGGPFEACDPVYELIGLTAGAHTLAVRAIDIIGNVDGTPATYTWTTLGEPNTTILSGPALLSNSLNATFVFTSTQAGATFQCSIDGTAFVTCTSPYLAGPLTEETHQFEVRAANQFINIDGEQVVDQTPALYEWEVLDITPPDTTIISVTLLGPLDLVEPNSLRFNFAGTDNRTASFELGFECSLDGGPWEGCDLLYYLPLEGLSGGSHTLEVRAVDELDNVDPTPASYTFSMDGEPETTIHSGPALQTDSTVVTFTFSANLVTASFECSLDLAPFTACASPLTLTGVAYGEHELLVRGVAPDGTVETTPAEYAWESGDMTPPVVTILSGPAIATTAITATFTFTSDDATALFQCSLDGAIPVFCASGVEYTDLLAGEHTFEVVGTKPNLLIEGLPAVWTWTVEDQIAPETAILSGPTAEIALGSVAAFTFSSNEVDASFECALNNEPFAVCATPPENSTEFTGLDAGAYTLTIRAVDPSLNVDASPSTHTWTVVGPPLTTILAGPPVLPATALTSTATFTFTADQPGMTFQCVLDGFAPEACNSPVTYTGLEVGDHTFAVAATNSLGLTEEPPASYVWTVELPLDTVAPETTLVLTPPVTTASTSALFSFASNELDVTFECRLDSSDPLAFVECSNPHEVVDLLVGPHTLDVRAIDLAGNVDTTPASYTWTVTEPEAPNTLVGSNVVINLPLPVGTGSVTVTFAGVTLDGFTSVTALASAPPLPSGYLDTGAIYYDVTTNAEYTAPINVCLAYTPGSVAEPVRLLHFEGGAWVDVTTTNDPVNGVVCGEQGSLSPFAIVTAAAVIVPDTTIESGPPITTVNTTANFVFSSNAPAATFECSQDAGLSWGSCEAATSFTGLTVGLHELLVRAKNAAGVVDASPASYAWTVLPLPDTFIASGPAEATESITATFVFTSDQPTATFECALDDAAVYLPCESGITYTGLTLEEHDFFVRAKDAAGNVDPTPADYSWQIGDIPPAVTITSAPTATTESRNATFEFAAAEPGLNYECALDGVPFAPCTSPKTYNGLPLGAHTFQVRVFSPTAIVEAPLTTYTWEVVDLALPETTIDVTPASVISNEAAVSISFSSNEAAATFECALNAEPYAACESPAEFSGLTPGVYTFTVRAVDVSGNVDPTPASATWTVVAEPETTIDSGPTGVITTTTVSFTFSSTDLAATFECALDGGPFVACATPHEVTGLADGQHTILVRARNAAGVADATPDEWSWEIDLLPETTIVSGPAVTTTSTVATFVLAASEPEVTFECTVDGVPVAECFTPYSVSGLTVGAHTFTVSAVDNANNADPTPATYTWTVLDGLAPETTIATGPAATTTSTTVTFTFTANEAGATFECALDNGAFAACTSPHAVTGLTVGSHTFQVRATDTAGNVDASAASFTWTNNAPDTVAPETTITNQPANPSTSVVNFVFTGTDDTTATLLLTFQCRLDGGAWDACVSPISYADLSVASHIFEVRAVDGAGNVDPSPASYTWSVASPDTTAPETTIDAGPLDTTTATTATFTFSASEPDVIFTCSLDGTSAACTSPVTYSGLAVGEHIFLVRAVDAAGNVDATAATHEWTVVVLDTVAPETLITGQPNSTSSATAATFHFEGSDNATVPGELSFECRLDGAPWLGCASPNTSSGLALGEHTFEVRAIDIAGNVDASPASYTWTVTAPPDTTAPETSLGDQPPAITLATSATFTFASNEAGATFECALDGAAFVACVSPHTYTELAGGAHTFQVRAVDTASNADASPASSTWTVDTVPDTTILTGPTASSGGTTESTTAAFTFGSNEVGVTFECALDGAGFSSCAANAQFTTLAVGPHTLEVRAKDATSNVDATPASFGWTITPAPETTILTGPVEVTDATGATFTFSSDQPAATFECSLDGAPLAACTSPVTYSGLALGAHEFIVQAKSSAGTVDPSPATFNWEIGDTTPPVTTITGAPAATTLSTEATFTFTVDDAEAVLQCSLDGAVFALCTSPVTYTGLTVGDHTFEVQGIKQHLVVDPIPALHEWTITENTAMGANVTVSATTPDGPATVTFANVTTAGGTAVTVLSSPPALPATYLGLGALYYDVNTTAVFNGNVTVCLSYEPALFADPGSLQLLHFENGVWTNATTTNDTVTGLICGTVTSLSPFGVAAPADTTAPETILDSVPPANTQLTNASFTFSANEAGSTFACARDGGAFAPCTSPHNVSGLEVGAHTFAVRATDAAGNVDPNPATFTWTIHAPVACVVETEVYGAAADAWLEQNSPSSNKGADSILKIKTQGPTDNFRALVNFNLPGSLPNGCVILSATLRLYSPSWTEGRTLEALRLAGSWTENSVTWGNQPATAGPAATTTSAHGYREWDITTQVQESYAAGIHHGFLVRDAAENNGGAEQQFHSREKGETPPELVIRYTPATVSDTTAPATSLDAWPPASTYNSIASFTFSANEAGVTFECRLDGGSYSECISPKVYTGVNAGAHSFAVRAIDPVGNYDATPSTYNWTVLADTTPPVITINSGPLATTFDVNASFAFAANEAGATFTCALDGAAFAPCSTQVTYPGLAIGVHTFAVKATDTTGNVSAPASYTWTVETPPDTTAPVVTISAGPGATTADTNASFTFAADDAGATFVCSLDGGAFAACSTPVSFNNLALGAHTFAVQASDNVGNVSAPVTHAWTVTEPPDTTAPDTTISDGPAATSESDAASFSFTGSDNRSAASALTFECALNGAAWSVCTSPASYTALTDGAYTLTVRAIDEAGNVDAEPASYAWTVALPPAPPTPPETTLQTQPEASTTNTSATFTFVADVAEATFECDLDGAGFTACSSPVERTGLALGAHTFSVRAVLGEGNVDATPATVTWTVVEPPDTTAPETAITSQPAQPTDSTAATFSFSGSDNKSAPGALTFTCRLDGSTFAACASPLSYSGLVVGTHTFEVRASDGAGNVDSTPAAVTWTIQAPPDTSAPETAITSGPAASTTSTNASFSFTANEAGSTFACSLDGTAFAACTTPKAYNALSVGAHTFSVQATDAAGNTDQSPASFTWTVAAPPPSCTAPQATLNASADAWIDQNSSSNNYGSDSILKVQAKSGNNFRAFVRFALPTTLPPGCAVQSATLKLYAASWKTGRTLQALRVNGVWAENAVTWSNQPATIGTAATTASGSNWRQWNVTGQVQAMFDLNANHGFLIRDVTESGGGSEQQFHGREKNDKIPQLVITYGPATVSSSMLQGEENVQNWFETEDQAVTIYLPVIQHAASQFGVIPQAEAQADGIDGQPAAEVTNDAELATTPIKEEKQVNKVYLPLVQHPDNDEPTTTDNIGKGEASVAVEPPAENFLPSSQVQTSTAE